MKLLRWSLPIALLCAVAAPCRAAGDELPKFRQGMWTFDRTVEDSKAPGKPMNMSESKCTDPTADMKIQNVALAVGHCTMSPVVKNGNTYTFTADCQIQGSPMQSKSVLTAQGDSAYEIDVTSTAAGRTTKEHLRAKRTGNC